MTMKKLMFALIALSGVAAFAQAPLGTVSNVEGVVTATQGSSVVTVTPGAQIQNGMRFITTSSGSVTLRLANGCTVTVPPNHGLTVVQTMTCQQLTAAVQPVTPVAAQSTFLPSSAVVNGAIALGAIGILIGAEEDFRNDEDERPISAR
jgi:hypothetical protein